MTGRCWSCRRPFRPTGEFVVEWETDFWLDSFTRRRVVYVHDGCDHFVDLLGMFRIAFGGTWEEAVYGEAHENR